MEKEKQIVRIASVDIPGNMNVYAGLTKIKGISWSMSNAICNALGIDKKRKMSSLSEEEIKKILDFIKEPKVPEWLLNRRKDRETGRNMHLITSDLELRRDLDIKRLKKIKCYRGIRHILGQPVRGQRTRSHFRTKVSGRVKGVKKPKVSR
ncbi:MAG: 30S ribosomal protein S13 [Candidatus Pacearchaeota archaeon]|nr:30S ribosomal protein S13 [Candidatus Pacearchaeota archaeon]